MHAFLPGATLRTPQDAVDVPLHRLTGRRRQDVEEAQHRRCVVPTLHLRLPAWSCECPRINQTDPMMKQEIDPPSKAAPGRRRPRFQLRSPRVPPIDLPPRQRAANRNFLAAQTPGGEGRAGTPFSPRARPQIARDPRDGRVTIFCCCRRRFNGAQDVDGARGRITPP